MKMKMCCTCKVEYLANNDNFSNHKGQPDGFCKQCKMCVKAYKARYYAKNKKKVNAKTLENYYKKHPKVIKEVLPDGYKRCSVCREVKTSDKFGNSTKSTDGLRSSCKECRREKEYLANLERIKTKREKYYIQNREHHLKRTKEYKENNKEWYRQYGKEYYQENMARIKETSRKNLYRRVQEDNGFKILQRCRKRLWDAVKGNVKSARTIELIGCSTDELADHLEKQFTDGMTWENYGEWHVDHIRPCASFDFTQPEQQRECFNYNNLQPLWAEENRAKSDKIIT